MLSAVRHSQSPEHDDMPNWMLHDLLSCTSGCVTLTLDGKFPDLDMVLALILSKAQTAQSHCYLKHTWALDKYILSYLVIWCTAAGESGVYRIERLRELQQVLILIMRSAREASRRLLSLGLA
ncbi:hypothetical protein CORC01_13185 [Colletotrichum orchidophilum]|uniref:Uncharacterized protein n=1 Tax=Colletotrichum orchidophilum TaxID=1209926 RepID=A0A1G4AR07_9PEZI|nr:uncharacterized protein CORC01_13185 [Colletotrichum orchidophilum]OHE91536.1 hypothetical protein CORC01_13185 [Colletotrichum orchidophilum]